MSRTLFGVSAEMNPSQFVAKWRPVKLTERSAYQQHFLDLCELVDHPKPAEIDPTGEFFTFEKGVLKQTGRRGWADVWKRGHFAFEYKGRHRDLDEAYDQLLKYRANLENPPLLVACDMDRIVIRTNFTGTVERKHEIPLEQLTEAGRLDVLAWAFHEPQKLRPDLTREAITVKVAERLADIAQRMRARGLHPHAVARFIDRIVFCLFAEDVGLLPPDMFPKIIESSQNDPARFHEFVAQLFKAMSKGGNFGLDRIRHFNGDLFDSTAVVKPTRDEIARIRDAAKLGWDQVDPTIFGTLFERGLDPEKRSQLGAHYTSRADIEEVVEPVVMAPLRDEWQEVKSQVQALRPGSSSRRRPVKTTPEVLISRYLHRLQTVRVLDPACGSGNFLYVALQKLKDLEQEVLVFAADAGMNGFFPLVGPWQLHGIEKNHYAFELAQISIWIGHLQWLRANGYRVIKEPILQRMTNFVCGDAVVDMTEPENPVEPEWPDVDFIVGNPPFLGGKKLRRELGNEYVDGLFAAWRGGVPPEADLCCYWIEKARRHVASGKARRVGLLATQAIRGGVNRKALKKVQETGDIFFGVSDRKWILDGAAVHVSMIGFDDGSENLKTLDGIRVSRINPNLAGGPDVTTARRLSENTGMAFMGDTKGGAFDIDKATALALMRDRTPSGRPASDVITPWINGLDVARRNRDQWIIDFDGTMPLSHASLYEGPFEQIRRDVYAERQKNSRKSYRERWWVHVEPRPAMRAALAGLDRFIVTVYTAKHRIFAWERSPTLPDHQLIVFAAADDYTFGLLHSRVHETWARSQGTQVRDRESGFRYTPTSCFETYPAPRTTDAIARKIGDAAKRLDEYRTNWLDDPALLKVEELEFPGSIDGPWKTMVRDPDAQGIGIVTYRRKVPMDAVAAKILSKRTLTNLYNAAPTWLTLAHRELDEAVFAAYGWKPSMTDEEILEGLLALNLERAAAGPVTIEEESTESPDEE